MSKHGGVFGFRGGPRLFEAALDEPVPADCEERDGQDMWRDGAPDPYAAEEGAEAGAARKPRQRQVVLGDVPEGEAEQGQEERPPRPEALASHPDDEAREHGGDRAQHAGGEEPRVDTGRRPGPGRTQSVASVAKNSMGE